MVMANRKSQHSLARREECRQAAQVEWVRRNHGQTMAKRHRTVRSGLEVSQLIYDCLSFSASASSPGR